MLPAQNVQLAKAGAAVRPRVEEAFGKVPITFEANRGQTDERVKFLARGPGYTLFLTGDSAVLDVRQKERARAVLRMTLVGANAHAAVAGADELAGRSNYFTGSDPKFWRTNVPTYAAVKYEGVYPGIDLIYHGNQRLLEYDFVVAPGADPRAIDLRFEGARKLSVNAEGSLAIGLGASEVIEHAPVVYQEIGGVRKTLAGRYVLRGRGRVGFRVGDYDRSRVLVIDPTLEYSTYLGGSRGYHDVGWAIAVDAYGCAYITGDAESTDFPTTPGAFQTNWPGGGGPSFPVHAFVTKLNATGSALVYSTYLGGSNAERGLGIAVDGSGNAYVAGWTASADFPTTPGALQTILRGYSDVFVTKLNATGSALVYSTFLGGSDSENPTGIAVDGSGNAYVTGTAGSTDFPITPGSFQSIFRGGPGDYFVSKLNATGSALVYSTYLGGSGDDQYSGGIAVDASGNAYVTGWTASSDFPTTAGAFQTAGGPGYVTKLNAAGSALVYSTYLAGALPEAIAVDGSGNAYVTGGAFADMVTTPGALQTAGGGAFVSKLNAAGSALVYSTFLAGNSPDTAGHGIAVDASGNAYVTGETWYSNFPTTMDAIQTSFNGDSAGPDAFVSKLDASGSRLLYSTYLGTQASDWGRGIAVDASGNVYMTGGCGPDHFPTTPGAFQTANRWGGSFVSKLSFNTVPPPMTMASLSGPTGDNGWYLGTVTLTLSVVAGAKPVSAIHYSLDGGPYQIYGVPFPISGSGSHLVLFYGVDSSGIQEALRSQSLKIDTEKPECYVAALPASESSPNFNIQWLSFDEGFSGVHDYTVYVSDNNSAFTPWLSHTTATQASYTGQFGHTYGFFCIARDMAGNVENWQTAAEATTRVSVTPPTTTATLSGLAGDNGWYIGIVTVTLSAVAGSNPVSAVRYSLDGGAYQTYGAPFPIPGSGIHQLLFYSVDTAGVQETPHSQSLKIDAVKPVSRVVTLPASESSPSFNVQWSGTDGGSGVRDYTVYVSDNNSTFTPWLSHTAAIQAPYTGRLGHTYGFFCIARDNAGNVENVKTTADATTQVPALMAGDLNRDGKIDCADIAIVKASFGKKAGQPGFDARADVNQDGVVDVRDLALVSQKLAAGTKCP